MPRAAAALALALAATILIHFAVITRHLFLGWLALQLLATLAWLDGLLGLRARAWATWCGCGVLLALLARTGGVQPMLYLPSIVIPLALATLFGSSLRAGREPLVTWIARQVRGEHPPALVVYTRSLTVLWTVVLFLLAATSCLLALFAPPALWSAFANFGSYLVIGAMFGAEYCWRLWKFPDFPHPRFGEYLGMVFRARIGGRNP